ncbi:50S ribosomal protein L21e [Candidatus Woesearchaeota archaeon]|nr:50S ribosomal protein L21e [Candidatus Woesearchaeota archaeon]
MAKRIGGFRRKTRAKLRKNVHSRGKISIRRYFQAFNPGEKVGLVAEPSIQGGMFHPRFYGKVGTVNGMQGTNYKVELNDGGKKKILIVHPVHLRRL